VARLALARREILLRAYRHRLRREDLEDCYSQALVELIARVRAGTVFESAEHLHNTVEQKFSSRVTDKHRALGGRSPIQAAIGQAVSLDEPEGPGGQLPDAATSLEERVATRLDIERVVELAADLTDDMRLLLAHQVGLDMECAEFCRRFNWSAEKFRKVAQRARRRLRELDAEYVSGERCRRLEGDLLAYISRVADADQARRAKSHLENCVGCRQHVVVMRLAERDVVAVFSPVAVAGGVSLGGAAALGRAGAGAGSAAAGGGAMALTGAGIGGLKVGLSALCLAGLASGGIALCQHAPLALSFGKWSLGLHSVEHRPDSVRRVKRPVPRTSPSLPERTVVRATASRQPAALRFRPMTVAPAHVVDRHPPGHHASGTVTAAAREFGFSALVAVSTAGKAQRRPPSSSATSSLAVKASVGAPTRSLPTKGSSSVSDAAGTSQSSREFGFESKSKGG
jgi:DNA-directed RNA polymerase specialized sigma24 family protein